MYVLINKIKWSLRRLFLGIPKDALVLEVGSGGNPYPRSNVLLDAYEETRERHWETLIHDRSTVLSFGENLPFKDKVFDFVIAAHVLEHTPHPEKFLAELQRVANAGYIETPDALMERINPYKDHKLEVTVRNKRLMIRKKPAWIYDKNLVELYEHKAKTVIANGTIPDHASVFHMRYFWKDKINFTLVNPEVDATWVAPSDASKDTPLRIGIKSKARLFILSLVRYLFSQNTRNKALDIVPLMRCPKCYSGNLVKDSEHSILCEDCNEKYNVDLNKFHMQ